jgi:hypothetical protein
MYLSDMALSIAPITNDENAEANGTPLGPQPLANDPHSPENDVAVTKSERMVKRCAPARS